MVGFILLIVAICLCAGWTWTVHVKGSVREKDPPMYPGLIPFIGHLHLLTGDTIQLWDTLKSVAAETVKRGGVTRAMLGSLYYVITDPEDALTAANACLQKHYAYDFAKAWLGDGLVTGSGEIWKHHRKLLNPAFSLPIIHSFLGVFNSQARKLVDNLEVEVSKGYFNPTEYLKNNSFETNCMTLLGITAFEDNNIVQKYFHSVEEMLNIITDRFIKFWLHSDLIFKWSGQKKKFDYHMQIVNTIYSEVIQRKSKLEYQNNTEINMKHSGLQYKPFLDQVLELSKDNILSDKEVREEVHTLIVAGFHTLANLLTFMLIVLGAHPEVQEKMYAEIKNLYPTDKDVKKEDLPKLVYSEAVIKETLRLYSIGPVSLRYVEKEVKLKNCTMRAGAQCAIFLFGAHRESRSLWGDDIEQFKPERWLQPDMPAFPNYFLGFSVGKRNCIGKTYAMITMKTTLVHFLRRYKVTADDKKLQVQVDFVLRAASGHEIKIEERIESLCN